MLQSGLSENPAVCITFCLKDSCFSTSPSPVPALTPLPPSPLSLAVEEPQAVGQRILSRFYCSIKSSQYGHFCVFQAESESAAVLLWLALGQPREAGSVRNWEPAQRGWGCRRCLGLGLARGQGSPQGHPGTTWSGFGDPPTAWG